MRQGKKSYTDGKEIRTGNSTDSPEPEGKEGVSQINEFIDKVEASRIGESSPEGSEPVEKKAQDNLAEINRFHDAILDELESSMDRSMQELDSRYDREFSRLDDETGKAPERTPESDAQRTDRMNACLLECGAKVEQLRTRLEESEKNVYRQCDSEIERLKEQLAAARQKLTGTEGTDDSSWGRVRDGLSEIMADLSRTVKSLVARLREETR